MQPLRIYIIIDIENENLIDIIYVNVIVKCFLLNP